MIEGQGEEDESSPSIRFEPLHKLLEIPATPVRETISDQLLLFCDLLISELLGCGTWPLAKARQKTVEDKVTIINKVLRLLPFGFRLLRRIVRSCFL